MCGAVVGRGGQYYEGPADREVIREAVARLKSRSDRRSQRGIAAKARRGDEPGRILRLVDERRLQRRQREHAARARWEKRVAGAKLGLARARRELRDATILSRLTGRLSEVADGAIRLAVRCVGTIGEQAEDDLSRMRTGSVGSIRKRHGLEIDTTLERIEALRDWSAALVTLRVHSHYYSHRGCNGTHRRHVGGNKFDCYLVVRDSTTGEAHILRVPPKFGNSATSFFAAIGGAPKRRRCPIRRPELALRECCHEHSRQYDPQNYALGAVWACPACQASHSAAQVQASAESTAWHTREDTRIQQQRTHARIQAAVAWTFSLTAGEYRPAIEA
jgi:hypothetical protein